MSSLHKVLRLTPLVFFLFFSYFVPLCPLYPLLQNTVLYNTPQTMLNKKEISAVVVSVLMWGIVLFMLYDMMVEYMDTGRKEKSNITQKSVDELSIPWIALESDVGMKCKWQATSCLFQSPQHNASIPCMEALETHDFTFDGQPVASEFLNSTKFRNLGLKFKSQLEVAFVDYLVVSLEPPYAPVTNISQCEINYSLPFIGNFIPVVDDQGVRKVKDGTAGIRDLGSPMFVASNHIAAMSFSLSQEEFVNGTVVNSSTFSYSQFERQVPSEYTSLHILISAATFKVGYVEHKNGETVVTLLGGMFGWVGVWTGACVQGLLLSVFTVYINYKSKKDAKEGDDTLSEELVATDVDAVLADRVKALEEELHLLRRKEGPDFGRFKASSVHSNVSDPPTHLPHNARAWNKKHDPSTTVV